MRIRLQKGKQKKLIILAKKSENLTWKNLSAQLNLSESYIRHDLKKEKRFLSDKSYFKLCALAKINLDKYIVEKLEDNWGRSKGGKNSSGNTIKLPEISFNNDLAEFVGAVLGDGHVYSYKKIVGKKHFGVHGIRLAGDVNKEKSYHKYLKKLVKKIFNLDAKEVFHKNMNCRFLDVYSKGVVEFFISIGIDPGNKIINQSTIPEWIYKKRSLMVACLRGLMDTDGCIHRMSKKDAHLLRLNFVNHNFSLLRDTRNLFVKIGYSPSKIIKNRTFYISKQNEVKTYLKEVGFKNMKHLERVKKFSPVV